MKNISISFVEKNGKVYILLDAISYSGDEYKYSLVDIKYLHSIENGFTIKDKCIYVNDKKLTSIQEVEFNVWASPFRDVKVNGFKDLCFEKEIIQNYKAKKPLAKDDGIKNIII